MYVALVALVVQGLIPPATVVTARPLATSVAPRLAVARPPPAPVHRSRCGSVRLQTEDDEASGCDSEPPRRSAVLLRRLNDVLFLLFTIAIQAIGAASVIGRPARCKARPVRPRCGRPQPATAMAAGTAGHRQSIPAHGPGWEAALGSGLALAGGVGGGRTSRWWV